MPSETAVHFKDRDDEGSEGSASPASAKASMAPETSETGGVSAGKRRYVESPVSDCSVCPAAAVSRTVWIKYSFFCCRTRERASRVRRTAESREMQVL